NNKPLLSKASAIFTDPGDQNIIPPHSVVPLLLRPTTRALPLTICSILSEPILIEKQPPPVQIRQAHCELSAVTIPLIGVGEVQVRLDRPVEPRPGFRIKPLIYSLSEIFLLVSAQGNEKI
ncbi:MAG: hypothetical protein ACKO90_14670, partial [Microcystis panniformis]